jgi:hypothetical protein
LLVPRVQSVAGGTQLRGPRGNAARLHNAATGSKTATTKCTRCSVSPLMKCTLRDRRSSLETISGQYMPLGATALDRRALLPLRFTTRRIRSSALNLPHHMATQVKPQATTISAVFDFVFHLSASNRSFTPYTKVSGPVAAGNLLGHHNRQNSLFYQPANAHPQIVVP